MDDEDFDIDDLYIDIGGEGLAQRINRRGRTPHF